MEGNNMNIAKMSGYLEKKGKKKILASYKKYWFVLEGRLLIYYRSRSEYEAISPCKGSITLGPSCNVKPCSSSPGVFQLENRSSTITLKAENREEQNKWMQGIMAAIDPNRNQPKLCHFRYSMDDLPKAQTQQKDRENVCSSQEAMSQTQNTNKGLIHRLQKMGAHTYGSPLGIINKTGKPDSVTKYSCDELLEESSTYPLQSIKIRRTVSDVGKAPSAEHIYERINGEPNTKIINSNIHEDSETDHTENEKSKNDTHSTKLYEINQLKDELDYEELTMKSGTTNNHKKVKRKKSNNNKETDVDGDKKRVKLKKCTSFLRKVWERKSKHKEKEQIYETLFDAVEGDKITIDNGTAVQMLSELQNILEHKTSFVSDNNTSTPSSDSCTSEIIFDPMDVIDVEKPSEEQRNESGSIFSLKLDERLATSPSPYHNVTEDYTYEISSTKSLDEILDDLDDQKNKETGNTVKKLIKRFSAAECIENDVVLRRNSRNYPREDVDSDELSILLEELAKVTNAPIFSPGATCSLITTNIEDLELFNLLPPRKRRYSEPDYDVPRPHKSLINLPREQPTDGVIGSTRFFGPVLKPFNTDIVNNDCEDVDSMTPDSLETDHYSRSRTRPSAFIEKFSSTPRNPFGRQPMPYTVAERNYIDNVMVNRICSPPKSSNKFYSLVQTLPKMDEGIGGGDDEAFVDSLEISNANPSKPF